MCSLERCQEGDYPSVWDEHKINIKGEICDVGEHLLRETLLSLGFVTD